MKPNDIAPGLFFERKDGVETLVVNGVTVKLEGEGDHWSASINGKRVKGSGSKPAVRYYAEQEAKKIAAKGDLPRDTSNKQFKHRNMEALCSQCGHSVGSHTADTRGGVKACLVCEATGNTKGNDPHKVRSKQGPIPDDEKRWRSGPTGPGD